MINEYYRATTKDDAWQKIKKGYQVIAGGTYLSQHQDGVSKVVDLQNLGLNQIVLGNNLIEIGSSTTFQDLFESDMVPISLKKAIHQEMKLNHRNAVSIGGFLCLPNGFSLIQGWLMAANVKLAFYPSQVTLAWNPSIDCGRIVSDNGFIDRVVMDAGNTIRWNYIARSPSDLALLGVFVNELDNGVIKVVLTGFNDKQQLIELYDRRFVAEQVREFVINAHSQFTNKFISFNYYFKNCLVLLHRLLGEEVE